MYTAGDSIIKEYCTEYETAKSESYMLPPAVHSQYPEERDLATDTIPKPSYALSRGEEGKYIGLRNNQRGELGEQRVFDTLHQFIHASTEDQFLVLKNLDLDNNNNLNIKAKLLIHQLQTINLSTVDMQREHDFVIVVKHIGIILIEVKTSATGNSISSAERQLSNGCELMWALMGGVKGTGKLHIPVEKVIVLPSEQTPNRLIDWQLTTLIACIKMFSQTSVTRLTESLTNWKFQDLFHLFLRRLISIHSQEFWLACGA